MTEQGRCDFYNFRGKEPKSLHRLDTLRGGGELRCSIYSDIGGETVLIILCHSFIILFSKSFRSSFIFTFDLIVLMIVFMRLKVEIIRILPITCESVYL